MKKLTCELCGGTDIIKQGDYFVCQHCETKYTVEAAQKMIIEGTVGIQGIVKIDDADDLDKLYQAARNACEISDYESAIKHYESISAKAPDSWEAMFYLVVLKTNSIKNNQIKSSAIKISNCLPKIFELIKRNVTDEADKKAAVKKVVAQCYVQAKWLTEASHDFYNDITKDDEARTASKVKYTARMGRLGSIDGVLSGLSSVLRDSTNRSAKLAEEIDRCASIVEILYYCGNYVEENFNMNDKDYKLCAAWAWKKMLELYYDFKNNYKEELFSIDTINDCLYKIGQYDSSFEVTSFEITDKTKEKKKALIVLRVLVGFFIGIFIYCLLYLLF